MSKLMSHEKEIRINKENIYKSKELELEYEVKNLKLNSTTEISG
jgi:hypothetical protein